MKRYYFDLRDKEGLVVDDEGLDLDGMEAVQREAINAMADAAWEALAEQIRPGEATIEVRDDLGAVMRVRFTVEMEVERKH